MKIKSFLLSLVLLLGVCLAATAQPYYTNSNTTHFGVYNPNFNVVPPTQPGNTLNNQYNLGIDTGSSVTSANGTVTNTFPTNYVYSVTPVVTVTQVGAVITPTNSIVSVTRTNFVYTGGTPNVTNNWIAIGQ